MKTNRSFFGAMEGATYYPLVFLYLPMGSNLVHAPKTDSGSQASLYEVGQMFVARGLLNKRSK